MRVNIPAKVSHLETENPDDVLIRIVDFNLILNSMELTAILL